MNVLKLLADEFAIIYRISLWSGFTFLARRSQVWAFPSSNEYSNGHYEKVCR
jgi:hypothetical protein